MKKRNNKIIILTLVGIIFVVLLGIFILNYTKDDYSFSILEKKWIGDNSKKVLDVSIYNDVPIFGKNGSGVAFDLLEDFTESYGINFNKVSYSVTNPSKLRDNAFRIIDGSTNLTDKDILLYEDNYVLVSNNDAQIDRISDIKNISIAVLSSDLSLVSSHLPEVTNVSYMPKNDIEEIELAFGNEEIEYAFIPYNEYIDFILENDLNILYHLSDISKKYVLTINNGTFLNIFKKYYLKYREEKYINSYKENFLNEFFIDKEISEVDRMGYNESSYNFGYITYMPYEDISNNEFVGTLSNYLSGFEDLFDVDFTLTAYKDVASLKKALSSGELDLAFANFNSNGLSIDTIYTSSPFKEEYVVLAKDTFIVSSVKSLQGREVVTVKDSYLNDYLANNGVSTKSYDDTDELLRHIKNNSVVVIDKDTYDYYKVRKFSNYNELYSSTLPYEYRFIIRDVNKNTIFAEMFSYYVSSVSYDSLKFAYNTNGENYNPRTLLAFIITVLVLLSIALIIYILRKRKKKETILHNNDKLKYIDTMTSLKNRAYLNVKIKEWDDNVIYPQGFVVVDLNNIKDINDNHGHEEGDMVIKKAASILIVSQEANTDIVRTDGNEFLIYMVGYDEKDVVAYTRKIYKELKELPYGYGASVGYSMIMDDVKTVDDAINEATIDMRKKKEQG